MTGQDRAYRAYSSWRPSALLVANHAAHVVAMEAALRPLDLRAVCVASADEALRLLQQDDFTVIVLDLEPPDLDALDTAARIRGCVRGRHTPVVVLTDSRERARWQLAGASLGGLHVLTKPLDGDALRVTVAMLLEHGEAAGRSTFPSVVAGVVWVLDDSPLEAEMTRRVLAARHRVEVFTDGATLLERLAQGEGPEALVLDWQMPGMSGIEVCRFLRTSHNQSALPVLMLTAAFPHTPDLVQGLDAGANDYVTKPCAAAELLARVGSLLRIRQLHDRAKDAEAALRRQGAVLAESEERLRLALGASRVGIWDYDPLTGRLEWDEQTRVIFGVSPWAKVDNETFGALIHPDDRDEVLRAVQRALDPAVRELLHIEYRVVGPRDGAMRWVAAEGRAFFDPSGAARRLTGTALDISDRKRAEVEADARAAFERQLIGIVSHDLRNPLSAILGSATLMLRRGGLDAAHALGAQRIVSSAKRATRLIHDLLDFTQARLGGGIPVEPRPSDLGAVARQVVEEVRAAYPDRLIELDHEGDGLGVWDDDRLAQLITNLLTNALAYSPPQTPVRVRTRGEGDAVTIAVHNQGPPIAPPMLERLFQPMERGEAEIGNSSRSIGLGLYIVDQITRAHGGVIDVRSGGDEGTTFTVSLPRVRPTPGGDAVA